MSPSRPVTIFPRPHPPSQEQNHPKQGHPPLSYSYSTPRLPSSALNSSSSSSSTPCQSVNLSACQPVSLSLPVCHCPVLPSAVIQSPAQLCPAQLCLLSPSSLRSCQPGFT
ncbi:hypothetical protein GE21DRAFT_1288841 [Neurospora crassa]|nr:hypothetical protein GE21DRAFT_1288841 [Neurospora crassa]